MLGLNGLDLSLFTYVIKHPFKVPNVFLHSAVRSSFSFTWYKSVFVSAQEVITGFTAASDMMFIMAANKCSPLAIIISVAPSNQAWF